MSNLKEVKKRKTKNITLTIQDRRVYFLMHCLSALDLDYPVYKELISLLSQSEELNKCIEFYLTHNKV